LSSGEQHLIVITFRLLFEATAGQLVLIDEPEISWHVAWQRQFLDDLVQISHLNNLRFIVATHSPQIVGRWTDRMVELGAS
jgi:predicted ATP-binding protein involved in virulence